MRHIDFIYHAIKTINWKNCYDVEWGLYLCVRNEEHPSTTKQIQQQNNSKTNLIY